MLELRGTAPPAFPDVLKYGLVRAVIRLDSGDTKVLSGPSDSGFQSLHLKP